MPQQTCPYVSECALADSIGMKAALRVWESFYCEGSCGRCERYRLHQSGQEVPARLLPNGRLLDESGPASGGRPRPDARLLTATAARRRLG